MSEDEDNEDDDLSFFASIKKVTKPKKVKKGFDLPPLDDLDPNDLPPIIENEDGDYKPPPTFYNSHAGTKKILDKIYYHGQVGPDGTKVYAPKLSDAEFTKNYTRYPVIVLRPDPDDPTQVQEEIDYIPGELHPLQLRLLNILNKEKNVMIMIARGHRKSATVLTYTLRQVLDYGKTILYFSATAALTKDYTQSLRDTMKNTPTILRDYGYYLDDERGKSQDRMFWITQKSSSPQPGCATGTSSGVNRTGAHPDIIVIDDGVADTVIDSPSERKSLERWFQKQILPMKKGSTHIIVIGTPKAPDDLYYTIDQTKQFVTFRIEAIMKWPNEGQREPEDRAMPGKWSYCEGPTETGAIITCGVQGLIGGEVAFDEFRSERWTERGRVQYSLQDNPKFGLDKNRMALQELLLERLAIGPAAFEYEYQLNPVAVKGGILKFENVKPFTMSQIEETREIFMENTIAFFDMAQGTSNWADFNCLSIITKYMEEYYIMDYFVWKNLKGQDGKGGLDKKLEMIDTILELYPEIQVWGIEADLINTGDALYIQEHRPNLQWLPVYQSRRKQENEDGINVHRNPYIFLDEEKINPKKKAKIIRILDEWDTKLHTGLIHMNSDINESSYNEYVREKAFPFAPKFDVLDSIGSGFDLVDNYEGMGSIQVYGKTWG